MKKRIIFTITMLLAITAVILGQQPDTTATGGIQQGMTFEQVFQLILTWAKANWATIALFIIVPIETWLGQTGKVKEGSIIAWLLNKVIEMLFKKTEAIKGKEHNAIVLRNKQLLKSKEK